MGTAVPFRIGRHVHPKAVADGPPAPAPTGIDYLRLIQTRHERALGQRLQYAQLNDPTGPEPAGSVPPADENGLAYDADLLALASTSGPGPDRQLQAELASFAALLPEQSADCTDRQESR